MNIEYCNNFYNIFKSNLLFFKKIWICCRNKSRPIQVKFCYKHKPNKNKTSLFLLCQKVLRLKYILCTPMYLYYSRHSRCTSINSTNKNKTIYRRVEIKIVIIIILFPSNIIFEGTHRHIDIYAKLTQNFVIRGVYKPSKSVRHFRIIDSLLTRFIKWNTS